MFGRATIRLGIGPHSSSVYPVDVALGYANDVTSMSPVILSRDFVAQLYRATKSQLSVSAFFLYSTLVVRDSKLTTVNASCTEKTVRERLKIQQFAVNFMSLFGV